jgi:rhodanese-related sulfurtransferase
MSSDLPIEIDCRSVQSRLGAADFLLVDCREPDEHQVARIAGARLVPMSRLADSLDELEAYRGCEIAVHCHHGGRSLKAANWLRAQGFNKARSMAGGIDAWSLEIDPSVPRY